MGMLARHYSGYRTDAPGAAKGWRERLKGQRTHLGTRLANLDVSHPILPPRQTAFGHRA